MILLFTDTRHIQEVTSLVSPSSRGNGISCSQGYSTQGSCSTELHVCPCTPNCVRQLLFTSMMHGNDYRLGENTVVKISDFGFSEKLYTTTYIRKVVDGGVKLPVKWMAPECICYGIFSERSDVVREILSPFLHLSILFICLPGTSALQWSFGVTCWEIFTGGVTPYPGIHASAIPKMCDHERMMDKPDNKACSDEMYDCIHSE